MSLVTSKEGSAGNAFPKAAMFVKETVWGSEARIDLGDGVKTMPPMGLGLSGDLYETTIKQVGLACKPHNLH